MFKRVAIGIILGFAITSTVVADEKKADDKAELYSKLVAAGDGIFKVEIDNQGRVQSLLVVGSSRISTVLGSAKGKEIARQRSEMNAKAAMVKWLSEKVDVKQKSDDEVILLLEGQDAKDNVRESGKSIEKTQQSLQSVASSMLRGMKVVHVEFAENDKVYTMVMRWDAIGADAAKLLRENLNDDSTGTKIDKRIGNKKITIDD